MTGIRTAGVDDAPLTTSSQGRHRIGPLLRLHEAAPATQLLDHSLPILAVELADPLDRDLLRAGVLALAVVGAAAETLLVHLPDHAAGAVEALGLALGEQVQ